jgi:hypothetical protein
VLITHDLGVWADEVPRFVLAHGDRVAPGDQIFERAVPPSVVVQDEAGVGGQAYAVQLEGELVGVTESAGMAGMSGYPLYRVFTFRNGLSGRDALCRKRQTCLPAWRPDVTAVSAGRSERDAGTPEVRLRP